MCGHLWLVTCFSYSASSNQSAFAIYLTTSSAPQSIQDNLVENWINFKTLGDKFHDKFMILIKTEFLNQTERL